MIRTLHGKLSLVTLLLLMVAGALLIPLSVYTTRTYNDEVSQHLNRDLASHLARDLDEKGLLKRTLKFDARLRKRTSSEISRSMVLNPNIEIYILDADGVIIDYSAAPGKVRVRRVALEPVRRFLAGAGPLPIYGTNPRSPQQGTVFSAARIPAIAGAAPDALRGTVYIVLAGEELQSLANMIGKSAILRLGAWSIGGVLALTFGASLLFFPLLTRPLRRLAREVEAFRGQEIQRGALAAEPKPRLDEIGQLQAAFARLSSRVGGQVETLEQADIHRREAVSNVSHDLRTPLAALQGYLETLLIKEGQLSPAQQREYVQRAMQHAERLSKLIAALFELAKLNSPEMKPDWEDFSLAELVQDVAQQFGLASEKRGLSLELDIAELPFVRADIGLVERALENLIENALRYTPPGGVVTLSLRREAERVAVTVSDTGAGIAPQHLPHIFERSYRVQTPEGGQDAGAGLGLAITQRIAQLHGGALSVQSEVGRGSTFEFSVPLAPSRL